MKYTYAYKTADGVRHEDSMTAKSREEVFAALRERGIKAIKVVAADGSKANGEVRGVRKRAVAAIVGLVALSVGVVAYLGGSRSGANTGASGGESFEASQTRRQVIGDVAVIEKGILTGWADVFSEEGDRFLASFAIPGVKAGQRNTTEGELAAAIARKVGSTPDDGLEARQIKAMVEGMKAEARAYIAAGGSAVVYATRLTERQDAEIAVYERAKAELEAAKKAKSGDDLISYWEELNDQLRNLGISPLTLE